MANLYVTEFTAMSGTGNSPLRIPALPIRTQKVAFIGSAAIGNAIGTDCQFIRVYADGDAHIAFAASPTATTSDMPIKADDEYWFEVQQSQAGTLKVAAIAQA